MKDLLKPQEESSISHDTSLMNNQNILDQNHLALVIHNKKANRYHNANRYIYKKKNGMKFGITLYIQMELCSSKTLKDYLNKRNASSTVINLTEIQHYYKQVFILRNPVMIVVVTRTAIYSLQELYSSRYQAWKPLFRRRSVKNWRFRISHLTTM